MSSEALRGKLGISAEEDLGRREASSMSFSEPGDSLLQGQSKPDFATQGKLRALGRLFRRAGEQLGMANGQGATLSACGGTLCDTAEALLQERWGDADELLGAAAQTYNQLFPEEHVAALRALLVSPVTNVASAEARDTRVSRALSELASSFEAAATGGVEVPDTFAEEALFDAAASFRAAARLFPSGNMRAEANRARAATQKAVLNGGSSLPRTEVEIERLVFQAQPDQRRTILRKLARQYHPDRNPGREMEVLPAFLYVQRLREQSWRWAPESEQFTHVAAP